MTPDLSPIKDIFSHLSLTQIITVIVLLIVGLIAVKYIIKAIVQLLNRSKLEKSIIKLISSVLRIILLVLLIFIIAGTMGIKMDSVIALFSVLTLAVALAVQGILGNIAGGAQVISAHPFKVGDYVQIGDKAGTVEEMGLVYTMLVTPDNCKVHIPNSKTVTSEITNYTTLGLRRMDIEIGLSYTSSPREVKEALMGLTLKTKGVLKDPAPQIMVDDYQDSAISYLMRVWVKPEDYWDVHFALKEGVYETVEKAGISIPFPQMDVHFDPADKTAAQ